MQMDFCLDKIVVASKRSIKEFSSPSFQDSQAGGNNGSTRLITMSKGKGDIAFEKVNSLSIILPHINQLSLILPRSEMLTCCQSQTSNQEKEKKTYVSLWISHNKMEVWTNIKMSTMARWYVLNPIVHVQVGRMLSIPNEYESSFPMSQICI